jgi:cytochrome c-type biogenesis protein CcmF
MPDTVMAESLILQLNKYDGKTAEIGLKESGSVLQYVTLKAYKFPFINVLWLGTLLMALGLVISMVRRIQLNKSTSN